MRKEDRTFWADFKRFFLRGLAILLPSVLTIWIVVQLYLFVDRQVASPINAGIRASVVWVMPRLPDRYQPRWFNVTERELAEFRATLHQQGTPESRALLRRNDADLRNEFRRQEFARFWESQWYLRFLGLVVAIVLFYLAGVIFGGLFGRALYQQMERFITRIPVIKQVYPHVKQVVDLILGEKQMAFSKVVLFEYPRKGIWTIGFVTNSGMKAVAGAAGEDAVTIFIPSTPTPFTGFTITVPRSSTIDINLSVDEAIRFVLTGGVLIPERQRVVAADTIVPGKLSSGPVESREGT
ncbi:MAG: DUF502 domain-containing protein [Phycisphaeraceae bacterium]|nr:DUF502 domain-containing protein [Phycisphaeraceae bacterium]